MKTYCVKQIIVTPVPLDEKNPLRGMVSTVELVVLGTGLSFKDAKKLRKQNKGSEIVPEKENETQKGESQ